MSKNKVRFLTEGYADMVLLDILEIPPKYIQRTGTVTQVSSSMESQLKFYHKIVVGIADADKGRSFKYFSEFILIDNPDNIIFKCKPNSNQYVIFLHPKAIEQWILDAAESVGIKPEDYKLSSDIKKFKKQTKNENIYKNKNLIKFLKTIKKEKAEPFVYLSEILHKLLNQKEYSCKKN